MGWEFTCSFVQVDCAVSARAPRQPAPPAILGARSPAFGRDRVFGHYGAYEYGTFGDLDGDCDADLSDLAGVLASYGATVGPGYDHGDLDLDGDVDLSDLAALLAVYGTACP